MILAAVGCCCRLLLLADGQRHKKDPLLFLAEQRRSQSRIQGICGIRRGDGSHVVEVGTETVSPGRKVDRRVLAGDLDQAVGLITCERGTVQPLGQISHRARVVASGIQSVRKNRMALSQAQEVATRHEMEE